MNKIFTYFLISFLILGSISCITTKEVQYLQPSESLLLNEEGLIPYSNTTYRVTKNDIFNLNVITTPKGDAAQFYSIYNTSGSVQPEAQGQPTNWASSKSGSGGSTQILGGSLDFYFKGLKVDSKGEILIQGIGYIPAEGRTLEEINAEIQQKVDEKFLEGKAEARLNLDGIHYNVLGDMETVGISGEKVAYVQNLTILEAIAQNGGLNRTVDRKNIIIKRKFPEGIKTARLDLTKEDVQNSPYFYVQNGDLILLNTRPKSIYGFGKEPTQNLTTAITALSTALSIILIITKL